MSKMWQDDNLVETFWNRIRPNSKGVNATLQTDEANQAEDNKSVNELVKENVEDEGDIAVKRTAYGEPIPKTQKVGGVPLESLLNRPPVVISVQIRKVERRVVENKKPM